MQTDSFFTKGVSHKVCEDYTMHGEIAGNPFIIVCDGCSGSDDTDFGARLLARSAKLAVNTIHQTRMFDSIQVSDNFMDTYIRRINLFVNEVKNNLISMIKATNSTLSVADATLLVAFQYDEHMYVYMRGDGCIMYKDAVTGETIIFEVEFLSGAPYYLTYDLNHLNDYAYKQQFSMQKTYERTVLSDAGEEQSHEKKSYEYATTTAFPLLIENIEFVSLMSDGVSAFQYSNKHMGDKVVGATSTLNIANEMNAFKNHNGEFVQRRMNMAMRKFEKQGLENFDDVSIATIWLKD